MITFRDKTFCSQNTCINFDTCTDAMNDEQKRKGELWWGSPDFPYSVDNRVPACYESKKEEE